MAGVPVETIKNFSRLTNEFKLALMNEAVEAVLKEGFEETGFKTLGDLAGKHVDQLPGIEKLPAFIKEYPFNSDQRTSLPEKTFVEMMRAGIPTETIGKFSGLVCDVREDIMRKASPTGSLPPVSLGFVFIKN